MTYKFDALTQCYGKHPYPDKTIADSTFAKKRDVPLQSYRCQHCGFWHVGHININRTYKRAKNEQRVKAEANASSTGSD
jgi:hypothetical protein